MGEHDGNGKKYTALYVGVVTAVDDPERVGRVRVRIPAIIEPESDWAFPLGTNGGGTAARGAYNVPPVGAEVGVFFHAGDLDRPYYIAGHWGVVGGTRETPGPAGGRVIAGETPENIAAAEAPKVHTLQETRRWLVVLDDREGKERAYIGDKETGDVVEIDGVGKGVRVKGSSAVSIESDGVVSIKATQVIINGRPVLASSKPIA